MKEKQTVVLSRDGKNKGRFTGGEHTCQMEGCFGKRLGVRWDDGTLTFPCSAGMNWLNEHKVKII